MASTQKLTELPVIQYTGMDYTTVISQIKSIIESNNNWKENWTQFYSSEAGTMLIQLMAWICDNLAVRQDMIYNESFISTAKNYTSKLRFLNQIKYDIRCSKAATVPITISLKSISSKKINLSCYGYLKGSDYKEYQDYTPQQREMQGVRSIKNSIFSFQAPNINGESVNWEVLNIGDNGKIEYKTPVVLDEGEFEYNTYDDGNKKIKALQGTTIYKEFSSDTSDEPVFNTYEKDIDLESLVIYDIKGNNYTTTFSNGSTHICVPNFIDITTLKNDIPCYIVERNDDGYIQIRYPSISLGNSSDNELLSNHLYKAGHTVGIFYRKCNGTEGNVSENIFNVKTIAKDEDGKNVNVTITNVLAGYGGFDMENIDTAIKNAPLTLRTLNRAVTSDDYDIILNNNSFVLKSKTFTPDNMPDGFSSFYGREIWPHEAFSVVVSNKNINNIPNEYLNKFPWVETNKSHAINEKMSFTEHEFNSSVNKKFGPVFGLFIKDNYVKEAISEKIPVKEDEKGETPLSTINLNCSSDDGTLYTEEFETSSGTRMLKNAVVYDGCKQLLNYILNEKEQYTGNNNPYELVAKLNDTYYNGNSFSDIANVFFTNDKLSVNKNVLVDKDISATFTSIENFAKYDEKVGGTYEKVNVSKINKPVIVNIDDNFNFEFDIKELVREEFVEKCSVFLNEFYTNSNYTTTDIEGVISEEDGIYDIFLSNSHNGDLTITERMKDSLIPSKTIPANYKDGINFFKMAYIGDFSESQSTVTDYSKNEFSPIVLKLRDGLVQLINKKYEKDLKALEDTVAEDELSNYEWISRQSKLFKNINAPSDASVDYEDKFFGTLYQDIGLNFPVFDDDSKKDSVKRENMPFYEKKVSDVYDKHFYRIKINGDIYAIRIDGTTIEKAKQFFFGSDDSAVYATDFFKFNGVNAYKQDSGTNNYIIDLELAPNVEISKRLQYFSGKVCSAEQVKQVFNRYFDSLDDESCCLCAESLALVLEFLFSPSNNEKGFVYKLKEETIGTEKSWVDINEPSNNESKVLDGNLHVHSITKRYYKYDSINKYTFDDELYSDKKCADVRFEYVRAPITTEGSNIKFAELDIKSVSDDEIKYYAANGEETTPIISITEDDNTTEIATEDFFEKLFGNRKSFTSNFPNEGDETVNFADISLNDDETVKFVLTSKKKGLNSSLYLSNSAVPLENENSKNNTIFNLFNCSNTTLVIGNDINTYITEKSYGIKRMEMFNAGVTYDSEEAEAYSGENSVVLQAGDIILTDSDINLINIPSTVYLSYISKYNDHVDILKQTSLYYSSDEDTAEAMEINVTGLDGQTVKSTVVGDETVYSIDKESSKFKIKITDDEIDYTNNFNCIDDSNLKRYVKSESFSLFTMDINPVDSSEFATLAFTIDEADDISDDEVEDIGVVVKNIGLSELNANYIYTSIVNSIPREHEYYNNRYKIVRLYSNNYGGNKYGNDNRLVFSNIDNRSSGNITFYCGVDSSNEATSELFKALFGTSSTNPVFYNLYPKEEMKSANIIYGENDEYWYSPILGSPLRFKFRTFVNEEQTSSKYADYYIDCSGTRFANNNSDVGEGVYKFSIVKTETSNLPDGDFYIHYINDRTYEKNRNTEEDQLNEYMKKYVIAGTKINYLKPFFKTFDISGNIYYNENYNVKNITESVNNVLSAKYKINNIRNIDIGNKIYLSDIIKLITDIDGIEHVEITYFGFDITNKTEYPSSSKYLSISEASDFYTMILLAETDTKHGIQFSYAIEE